MNRLYSLNAATVVHVVAFVSLLTSTEIPALVNAQQDYLRYYNVEQSVSLAKKLLIQKGVSETDKRLPLMILYSHDITDKTYGPCLKCALASFQQNLMPATPCDIFIFAKQRHINSMLRMSWLRRTPNIYIIPLDEADERSWKMPEWIRPEGGRQSVHGWSNGFTREYRLMGQWRLAFSFPFARALGYKYLMQIDSDSYVLSKVEYNLVQFMKDRGYFMTNKNFFFNEARQYSVGLPELAHFWMVTRLNEMPENQTVTAETASSAGIVGPILKHCTPQSLQGLKSTTRGNINDAGAEGWDAKCIAGNFNIFSLDWWFQDNVQDFLQLVLRTGAHIEHRWVDVATETMINHLFVPEDRMYVFEDIRTDHGHSDFLCGPCGSDWLNATS